MKKSLTGQKICLQSVTGVTKRLLLIETVKNVGVSKKYCEGSYIKAQVLKNCSNNLGEKIVRMQLSIHT